MPDSEDLLASVEPLDASKGARSRGKVGNGGGSIDLEGPETFLESGRIGEIHFSLLPLRSCTPGMGRCCFVDFVAGWGNILRRREPLLCCILGSADSSITATRIIKSICCEDLSWLEDQAK